LHLSVLDIRGGLLLVPQFTLYGDTKKGRRPDFFDALEPELAEPLFDQFTEQMRAFNPERLETGIFRAHMQVELLNDGPVTLMLESQGSAIAP
jgi:D-tyrosyl-tRNA(Tyr) deacylase